VRAFDAGGRMIAAETVPGPEVVATALRLLDNPEAAYLHAHNPARGCWAACVDRA
jgi:hypothetical protein